MTESHKKVKCPTENSFLDREAARAGLDQSRLLRRNSGQKDVAALLPASKAEVNAKDNNDEASLHWAAQNGHKDVAELLRQHGRPRTLNGTKNMSLWRKLFGPKESPSSSVRPPSSVTLAEILLVISVVESILSFIVILLSPNVRSHIPAIAWVRNIGFWIAWIVLVMLLERRHGWARFAILALLAWNVRNVTSIFLTRPTGAPPAWLLSGLPGLFWIQTIGVLILCIVFWTSWQRGKQVPAFWLWTALGVFSLPVSGRNWWSLQILLSSTALRLCGAFLLFMQDSNAWFRTELPRVEPSASPEPIERTQEETGVRPLAEFSGRELIPKDDKQIIDRVVETFINRQTAMQEGTFETSGKGIKSIICSDDECPCTDQKQLSLGKDAYLYISPGVVDFRKDCLTILELEMKVSRLSRPQDLLAAMQNSVPKYVCEVGARRRGLDLAVALADGVAAAENGFVPLRATPKALSQQSSTAPQKATALNSLVNDLLSQILATREKALVEARALANRGVRLGIEALEIAIRRKAGTPVEFHVPGLAVLDGAELLKARDKVLAIAKRGEICREARLVGSLMSSLFLQSGEDVRRMLSDIREAGGEEQVLQFQLVGTHLQAVAGYKQSGATQS